MPTSSNCLRKIVRYPSNQTRIRWGEFWKSTYHSPGDDLTQPIDWGAGARFAEVNYRIVRAMADAEEPPLWIAGDYFGDTFAPGARRAPR